MPETLSYFLMSWLDPSLLLIVAVGTFAGVYAGAIPGISVTMAVSVLISFTFSWDVNAALAMMVGVYCGGVYGGSRTAILLNIPGTPAAVATAFDGYPLAKLGEAGKAIGISTVVSVIGGYIGIAILAVGAPMVSGIALQFAPRDFLLLAMIGLLLVGGLSGGSLAKGIFAAALGVLIGLVGLDNLTAQPRLTFGSVSMLGGISYIAAMIGFFGVAEALYQLRDLHIDPIKQQVSKIVPAWKEVRKYLPLSIRSSAIGVIIGALPGAGGDIAALIAYDQAKRTVKNPSRPFGKGAYEGLVAPESANNAVIGGAFVPMLTLGIPGDAVTALFIGALFIHGLRPGPMLMVDTPHLFWFIVGALVLANSLLLIIGLTGVRIFTRIMTMPRGLLIPLVILLSVVGTYTIQNSFTDVYWMLAFGVLGYFMKVYGFEPGPVILGVILGPLMDVSFRRAILSSRGDLMDFFTSFFVNPISLVLTIAFLLLILNQTPLWGRIFNRRKATAGPG
ncbi:tripartite tricarboxylate transporter permease [Chelativorans sp.]|uniref:tripartite tricarboxylate transporter permease n=1 Tax=Chelativorans sp. TaxID=2203393 RepID=UPI002810BA7F|nr:tripartite tricarboxylate transporter permease [Chelativorans sp.]